MADVARFRKNPSSVGLSKPPKPTEALGNVKKPVPSLLDHARQANTARAEQSQAETASRAEDALKRADQEIAAQDAKPAEQAETEKKHKGRPKLDYSTRQLGARVHVDTFARVQAIAKRERVGLGPLVDRMVAAWERQRLAEAEAIGPRRDGEDDDAYVARVFKL